MSKGTSVWLFRVYFALLAFLFACGCYSIIHLPPPVYSCLNGLVMQWDPSLNMYTQAGLLPRHCVPIDTD